MLRSQNVFCKLSFEIIKTISTDLCLVEAFQSFVLLIVNKITYIKQTVGVKYPLVEIPNIISTFKNKTLSIDLSSGNGDWKCGWSGGSIPTYRRLDWPTAQATPTSPTTLLIIGFIFMHAKEVVEPQFFSTHKSLLINPKNHGNL